MTNYDKRRNQTDTAIEARMASAETLTTYGTHTSLDDFEYLSHDEIAEAAFVKGAEWQSKQPPWISVKERLPEENKEYLVVLDNRVIYVAQYNKNNKSWLIYGTGYTYNVVAYMPIPSFDEILEANKDVLQRLK